MYIDNYPKSKEILKEYLLKNITHPENTPEEVIKAVKEFAVGDERIQQIITIDPNILFEFFDNNKVYIQIGVDNTLDVKFAFSLDFGKTYSDLYYTRKQAETEAVLEAFKLLEEKL